MSEFLGSPFPPVRAEDSELQRLADGCETGDADAILQMSEYMKKVFPDEPKWSALWLFRAAIYGDANAQRVIKEKIADNPKFIDRLPINGKNFIPGARSNWFCGDYSGALLNKAGFLAFQPDMEYTLSGINNCRFMVVQQLDDYDPPDEDGFGAEEYYNIFCLDEFFRLIPGVPMVLSVSSRDIRYVDVCRESYEEMYRLAVSEMKKREPKPLALEILP